MNKSLTHFLKSSPLGRFALVPIRLQHALSYYYRPLRNIFPWLMKSREITNFTYDLEQMNKDYLAAFLAVVTSNSVSKIREYISEVENDEELKRHIITATSSHSERFVADAEARFGRRLGWYACVRAIKPKLTIETGVDKGLGSCVIAAALRRNAAEGYPGKMFGLDINPSAGYLLTPPYNEYGRILYGDSIETLRRIDGPIDLFINDSDHSVDYEMREYETIRDKLSPTAIILGDNSRLSGKLFAFAQQTDRNFLYFQERPYNHWFMGDGIGFAFPNKNHITDKVDFCNFARRLT